MKELPRIEITTAPGWNACVRGFGGSRRVQLSAQLLHEASASVVQAVLAHEHGHHIRYHVEERLAIALGFLFYIGYGIATLDPWVILATLIITPLFWHLMVMVQEGQADMHAVLIEGKAAVDDMLSAMLPHAKSPAHKATILVRRARIRELA